MKTIYENLVGEWGDFGTFFSDVDLDDYIVTFYYDSGDAYYKIIIGYIELGDGDYLLQLADAEHDTWEDIYENVEKYGIEFQKLSNLVEKNGFCISPLFQLEEEEEEEVQLELV